MSGLDIALLLSGFGLVIGLLIWALAILNNRVQALEDEIYVRNQGWRTEWLADAPTIPQQQPSTIAEQPSSIAESPDTWPRWR